MDYNIARLDRSWNENGQLKRGGGVCMYIRDNLNYSEHDFSNLNKSTIDIEIQWIVIKSQFQREIIIANLYRPPQGDNKSFLKYITECLDTIRNLNRKDVFIIGDFNIDVSKNSDQKSKDLLQSMNGYGLKQYIHGITRYGNTNSCIDLIFTNSEYINYTGILDLNLSDHQAIFINRKKLKPIMIKSNLKVDRIDTTTRIFFRIN